MDAWIDQDDAGTLKILTSAPEAASKVIAQHYALAGIAVIRSRYTGADLRRAQPAVTARLGTVKDVSVTIDRHEQRIDVRLPTADQGVRDQLYQLVGNNDDASGIPIFIDTTVPSPARRGEQKSCASMECDTPMRGGLKLTVRRDDGSWGMRTSRFVLRGGGWPYLLTAGHCATIPGPGRQFMYHNGLPVVVEQNSSGDFTDPAAPADTRFVKNNFPNLDYAVLPFQRMGTGVNEILWKNYWVDLLDHRNMVLNVYLSGGTQPCTTGSFAITGLMPWTTIANGFIACSSGAADSQFYPSNAGYVSGTRCGQVLAKNMIDYSHTGSGGRGIKLDICTRDGDSGSPLWSQIDQTAYGILSGGPAGTGACSAGEYSVYSPLSDILSDVSTRTGISMSLITMPGG